MWWVSVLFSLPIPPFSGAVVSLSSVPQSKAQGHRSTRQHDGSSEGSNRKEGAGVVGEGKGFLLFLVRYKLQGREDNKAEPRED